MRTWPLLTALILCTAACSDDDSGPSGPPRQASALFGQILGPDDQPVQGAQIEAGDASATTNAQGRYQLRLPPGERVVRVTAPGHLPLIRQTRILDNAATALDGRLLAEAAAIPLDAGEGGTAEGARGAAVEVPAGALVSPAGASVSGPVQVHLTPIDPSRAAELAAAPGDFSARTASGEAAQLESFGMLDVTIRQGSETLQVAPGQRLALRIPAPEGAAEPPARMPLWSFDEAAGRWVEEGEVTYDPASRTYQGEIAHMSFWNADQILETSCIKGLVADPEGRPLAGAQITARGVGYFGTDRAVSGPDGRFAVLVRRGSEADILAAHGGGLERRLRAGDASARQPADPDDPACLDGGTWTIEREVVQFSDGRRVACDPAALRRFQGCIPLLIDLTTCHNPQGACTLEGGLFGLSYRFENGARVSTDIDLETSQVTTTYFGPGGVECGRQVVGAGQQVNVELADGRSASYGVRFDQGSGDITYTCADGSSRTLTGDDQLALQACSGVDDPSEECAPGDGGGGFGEACETDAQCGSSQTCCAGTCLPEDLCFLGGRTCAADAECSDGRLCCPGAGGSETGRCLTAEACYQGGRCRDAGDCDGTICCDGQCAFDGRPYCVGQCEAAADCGGEQPFCCDAPNFEQTGCVESAESCWHYAACDPAAAGGCGPTAYLCCPGEDGAGSCLSAEECYGGRACEGPADCPTDELLCCDSEAGGRLGQCANATDCYSGTPCGPDPCPGALFCCDRFGAPEGFEGVCVPQWTCNFQLPCQDQATCGAGSVCCADPSLPEPLCFPEDSGCAATLP